MQQATPIKNTHETRDVMPELPAPKINRRIQRKSLPETLADSLRERILNGEFKEGDQLVQEVIAEEYEVSRMPVREALRQLEAAGLIQFVAHKSAVVTTIPIAQIAELFELRAMLEPDLLGRAIPLLTDEHLKASQHILLNLEEVYRSKDISMWGKLNWEFHRSLYDAADRIQTLAVVQGINIQTDRYIRLQLLVTGELANAQDDHREILALCRKRDVHQAVALVRQHILTAGAHLTAALAACQ
jgi:DNA-binding GntR family transcriptional regulator